VDGRPPGRLSCRRARHEAVPVALRPRRCRRGPGGRPGGGDRRPVRPHPGGGQRLPGGHRRRAGGRAGQVRRRPDRCGALHDRPDARRPVAESPHRPAGGAVPRRRQPVPVRVGQARQARRPRPRREDRRREGPDRGRQHPARRTRRQPRAPLHQGSERRLAHVRRPAFGAPLHPRLRRPRRYRHARHEARALRHPRRGRHDGREDRRHQQHRQLPPHPEGRPRCPLQGDRRPGRLHLGHPLRQGRRRHRLHEPHPSLARGLRGRQGSGRRPHQVLGPRQHHRLRPALAVDRIECRSSGPPHRQPGCLGDRARPHVRRLRRPVRPPRRPPGQPPHLPVGPHRRLRCSARRPPSPLRRRREVPAGVEDPHRPAPGHRLSHPRRGTGSHGSQRPALVLPPPARLHHDGHRARAGPDRPRPRLQVRGEPRRQAGRSVPQGDTGGHLPQRRQRGRRLPAHVQDRPVDDGRPRRPTDRVPPGPHPHLGPATGRPVRRLIRPGHVDRRPDDPVRLRERGVGRRQGRPRAGARRHGRDGPRPQGRGVRRRSRPHHRQPEDRLHESRPPSVPTSRTTSPSGSTSLPAATSGSST
jgi:hypothetical protein